MKKYSFLFLLFFLCFTHLSASIENYFKACPEKSQVPSKQVKKIDFIYMINLDQRPEKFTQSLSELAPYGITPYRFSAVNGWELSLETLNDVGVKFQKGMLSIPGNVYLPDENFNHRHEKLQVEGRNYFGNNMSRGAIGIILSHLSILQDAFDSGYKTIWVMEDDIQVIKNPHLISEMISKLDAQVGKKGWDILFTDKDTKDQKGSYVVCSSYAQRPNFTPANVERFSMKQNISNDFRQIGARYGAYSMIIRRSGMRKLLKFFKKYQIFLPYDMDFCMPNNIKLFTVIDDIVSTLPKTFSDNGLPNYKKKRKIYDY